MRGVREGMRVCVCVRACMRACVWGARLSRLRAAALVVPSISAYLPVQAPLDLPRRTSRDGASTIRRQKMYCTRTSHKQQQPNTTTL